jgi:hypothetical protein
MSLSFLYRAFCRVLELVRLAGRSDEDLVIEVVILRHEVAVLCPDAEHHGKRRMSGRVLAAKINACVERFGFPALVAARNGLKL